MKNIINILLFFLVLVTCVLIIKWTDIKQYYDEKEKKEQYETLIRSIQKPKTFNTLAYDALDVSAVDLDTKWADGKMFYKLRFTCIKLEKCNFTINLLDSNGFTIYSFDVHSNDMVQGGNYFYKNSERSIKPEVYKQVDDWSMSSQNTYY